MACGANQATDGKKLTHMANKSASHIPAGYKAKSAAQAINTNGRPHALRNFPLLQNERRRGGPALTCQTLRVSGRAWRSAGRASRIACGRGRLRCRRCCWAQRARQLPPHSAWPPPPPSPAGMKGHQGSQRLKKHAGSTQGWQGCECAGEGWQGGSACHSTCHGAKADFGLQVGCSPLPKPSPHNQLTLLMEFWQLPALLPSLSLQTPTPTPQQN